MRTSVVHLITSLCLFWWAGCASAPIRAPGELHISGTLEGVGGSRLPEGGVILSGWGEPVSKPLLKAPVASDGRFSLVAPGPGDYSLWLTAPGYPPQALFLQVLADQPDLSVQARLEPYSYSQSLDAPTVAGNWNDFKSKGADFMRPQPDGTWVLDRAVEGNTATYQFMGITPSGPRVSCFPAEAYELVPADGTYRCRVTPQAGRIHIVLDLRKLPRTPEPTPLRATFSGAYAFLDSINSLHARLRFMQGQAFRTEVEKGQSGPSSFDFGTLPQELLTFARDMRQPLASRQLAVVDLLRLRAYYSLAKAHPGAEGEALAQELLKVLPADSPRWAMALEGMAELRQMVDPAGRHALAVDFAEHNPDPGVQAHGLAFQLEDAHDAQDAKRMAEIAERLQPLKTTQYVAFRALNKFMPDQPAIEWKGKPVPDFSAPLLGTQGRVSRGSLLGRFYLLDFWATWCVPCVGEMRFLHSAAEKFKGRGDFTLVSMSMDVTPERAMGFREGRWKMPWMHAFNGPDLEGPVSKVFQLEGLPMSLLVDARGVVVASGDELRGEQLEKTLDALLPAPAP